ncbi:MAG: exonuclease domain-containing protein [Desulfobacteraceae bacterium]|jgi:DNA polymerase-3 subunit epsilon
MPVSLTDLNILALDCQATGANPKKGHLLEIGWVKTRAAAIENPQGLRPEAHLVKLPAGDDIPRPVTRVTGINAQDLSKAKAPQKIWQKLVTAARQVAADNQATVCPAVIHFARFEEPFIRELHANNQLRIPFPFQFICTHEIAIRLFSGLPRKGLRAIAGYFGHSIPQYRRSADHAMATALIWKNLVDLLKDDLRIIRLEQLTEWLQSSTPETGSRRVYPMAPETRQQLPEQPGIYRMLRSNGVLLYIGKAKSLKQRVNSYFRQKGSPGEHILEMLTQAHDLNFTLTGSALDAALLENDEIKQNSPPYNVALRKRQRQLVFCSKDLKHHATSADDAHHIGPLPSGNLIDAMAAFAILREAAMSHRIDDFSDLAYCLLGLPAEYAPDADCLREGVSMFHQRHRGLLYSNSALRAVTALGARLWRERLEQLELDEPDENGQEEENPQQSDITEEHVWAPEDVACTIEGVIRRAAHMIRRARWFSLLSQSSLAWKSPHVDDRQKIVLIFKDGVIADRKTLNIRQEPPRPPGYVTSFRDRKRCIDLITYDRLRVLTTELRRLVSEERYIELCPGPTVILGHKELGKALRWV